MISLHSNLIRKKLSKGLGDSSGYKKGLIGQAGTSHVRIPTLNNYVVPNEFTLLFTHNPGATIAVNGGILSNKYTTTTTGGVTYAQGLMYMGYKVDLTSFYVGLTVYNPAGGIIANLASEQRFFASGSNIKTIRWGIRLKQTGATWLLELFENGETGESGTSTTISSGLVGNIWAQGLNMFTDGGTCSVGTIYDLVLYERALSNSEMRLDFNDARGHSDLGPRRVHLDFSTLTVSNTTVPDISGNGNVGILNNFTSPVLTNYILDPLSIKIIGDGNSIMAGHATTAFSIAKADNHIHTVNYGIASRTTTMLIAEAATKVDPYCREINRFQNWLLILEIGNDIQINAASGATAYTNMKNYCIARKAANPNLKIIILGCMPRTGGGIPGDFNTRKTAANNLFLADFTLSTTDTYTYHSNTVTYADKFLHLDAVPNLSDPSNTTYYADGTHLTVASGQPELGLRMVNAFLAA